MLKLKKNQQIKIMKILKIIILNKEKYLKFDLDNLSR